MKRIDTTAARLGIAMQHARRKCYLPNDQVASLLHIMPDELAQYERGIREIPYDILERTFILAYKMMHIRTLESFYRGQRKMFNKFSQTE